jgi:ParB family chromosome partitioning protein
MTMNKKQRLGRGLGALFGEPETRLSSMAEAGNSPPGIKEGEPLMGFASLSVGALFRIFDQALLEELADSVRERGVLQPLLVRPANLDGQYEIIAGERRWRAAQKCQLHEVPVVIKQFTDAEVLEVGLVENLQRSDLSPMEEAEGYKKLVDEFGHTQAALGSLVSKSRAHVANMMRLLSLPESIKRLVDDGSLSVGHARALIGSENCLSIAKLIVSKGLSVRAVERLIGAKSSPPKLARDFAVNADIQALTSRLESFLGLKVKITFNKRGGNISLLYSDLDQLDHLVSNLMRSHEDNSDKNEK